ncbi:ArsR family transcriptional regulator [Mesorhizobium sp. L2C054A000]|nr:ArsR family transcriptional regulator [Mesorhizobium sp. L2C054A000]
MRSGQQWTADDLDRRIPTALHSKNRQLLPYSRFFCLNRIGRVNEFHAEGVIVAHMSLLDSKTSYKSITVVVTVELDRGPLELVNHFKRAMRAAKEVTQCYMVTGEVDFVLIVTVEDVDAFYVFVKKKLYNDPNVRKFKSMINLDLVKFEPRTTK